MNLIKSNGAPASVSGRELHGLKALTVTGIGTMEARFENESVSPADKGQNRFNVSAKNVRIAVKYAGVGFTDVLAVAGGYPLAPRIPFSPGYEFYGTVPEAGSHVEGIVPGDRVCGMLMRMGAYKNILDVPAWLAVKVPDGVSDETAAALPLNYITALALLERTAALQTGQSFIIHGAAGGVGSAMLETGKCLGIRAFGTASPEKHDLVRQLGGVPFDYTNGDWLTQAMADQPQGFDAAFDSFGGLNQRMSWQALRRGGTLVSYGFYPSVQTGIGTSIRGLLFLHTRNLIPNGRRARLCKTPAIVKANPQWYQDSLIRLLSWAWDGHIQPVVDSVEPWYNAEIAHQAIRNRRVRGKVLLNFEA